MEESCTHSTRESGICPECGECDHDVILNGACYYCGETELRATIKPSGDLVPVESLVRKKPGK